MDANNSRRSKISQANSLEAIGEFWDTRDFTDYDTDAPDVAFNFTRTIPIEAELLQALREQAKQRGVSVETLVNLWLQQRLTQEAHPT